MKNGWTREVAPLISGNGAGPDKLQAEHFKLANVHVLNCLLCYLMLHLVIVKKSNRNVHDTYYYR